MNPSRFKQPLGSLGLGACLGFLLVAACNPSDDSDGAGDTTTPGASGGSAADGSGAQGSGAHGSGAAQGTGASQNAATTGGTGQASGGSVGQAGAPATGGNEGPGTPDDETGPKASPSRLMPELSLSALGDGRGVYNVHRGGAHRYQGSGHTHSAPDHSGIDPKKQEERLRDLPGDLAHDFVWLTAHLVVVADPGVSNITHLYGIENYTKTLPSGGAPHVVAFLPDDELVGKSQPFGLYNHTLTNMPALIDSAGGLAVLAHPSRYSPSIAEAVAVGDALWGIEGVSGGTPPADNLKYVDARLTAGKYTCISAGADLHDATSGLTSGYQLVSAADNERATLFEAVSACNFFACRADSEKVAPITAPEVQVKDGAIVASMEKSGTIRFVGTNGSARKTETGTSASYTPSASDGYVRVEMSVSGAQCYSQPLWIMDAQ